MADIRGHCRDPKRPYPGDQLLYEMSHYLDWAGIYDPNKKIYITTTNVPHFAAIMFLFTIAQLPKMTYAKNIGELIAKKAQEQIDGFPFTNGVQTVLRQFHPDCTETFLRYFGQYVLSHIDTCTRYVVNKEVFIHFS